MVVNANEIHHIVEFEDMNVLNNEKIKIKTLNACNDPSVPVYVCVYKASRTLIKLKHHKLRKVFR